MSSRTTPAGRRYLRRFWPAMSAYMVLLFAAAWMFKHHPPAPGPALYALAVLPALPLLVVIWAIGRFLVEETDEYLRARQVEAVLWATGLTLAATTVWGFLEVAGAAPHAPAYEAFVVFCVCLGLVQGCRSVLDVLAGNGR